MPDVPALQQTPVVITVIVAAFELCGIMAAFHAVMHARTSQGAMSEACRPVLRRMVAHRRATVDR